MAAMTRAPPSTTKRWEGTSLIPPLFKQSATLPENYEGSTSATTLRELHLRQKSVQFKLTPELGSMDTALCQLAPPPSVFFESTTSITSARSLVTCNVICKVLY